MQEVAASPTSKTDESLLRRVVDGQDTAAAALYRRYAERIRALARARLPANIIARADPEDIVQSVFRAFFESARKGLYEVMDGESLWCLLAVVTVNKVRSVHAYHAAARRDIRTTVPLGQKQSDLPGLESEVMELVVHDILEQLPELERKSVELRLEGYEVAEIAGRTGRSKRTIERSLQKAREHLTALMNANPI